MTQQLPPGQGPIDPRGAFGPPPPPPGSGPMPAPGPAGPSMGPQLPFPQFLPPPPPPPRRGGVVTGILLSLLGLLLILSIVMNFVLGAFAFGLGAHNIDETTLTSGASDQQIAVIPLEGVITDASRKDFEQVLRHIEENKTIKGLIIDIDSPGGEVTPSDEIYQRIVKFKTDHSGTPVAASIRGLGASGAYYAACGCDRIVAEETTITGSIGVLMPSYNFFDLMQKYGVKDATIVSDGAPYKDAGSPTQAPNPEHEAYLHGLINAEFARFKAVVQGSRSSKLKPSIDEIANGKAYSAAEAKQNGLIDDVGYFDKAVAWVSSTAHLSNPTVVRYEQKPNLFDRFPFAMQRTNPQTMGINLNGTTVQVDQRLLDRLLHPRPMAVWQGR